VESPGPIADDVILSVERRWVVNDLPNHELLDVIAHGYNFFKKLVLDAHGQAKLDRDVCAAEHDPKHEHPFVPCMSVTRDDRSANIKLSTQELFPKVEYVDMKDEFKKPRYQAKIKQYLNIMPALPKRVDNLFEFAKMINARAKQMLIIDGFHATICFLCFPDGSYQPLTLQMENQSEKYIVIRSVADQVKRMKATGVILISEVWSIHEEERISYQLPAEHPNRKELLHVSATTKDKSTLLTALFSKDKAGKVMLGETCEEEPKDFKLMGSIVDALKSVG